MVKTRSSRPKDLSHVENELIQIYEQARGHARKLMGPCSLNGVDSEDIAGDAVVSLLRTTPPARIRPGLVSRAVRFQWINNLRRSDKSRKYNEGLGRDIANKRFRNSDHVIHIAAEEQERHVREFIELRAKPAQSHAIVRCVLEGEKTRTLAKQLGCSQRLIQERCRKGLNRIRERLDEL